VISLKKIVGISACITGIAHTYLAAEALKEAGKSLHVEVKIETHGAIGVENKLSYRDIDDSLGVIIASDIVIDEQRFMNKKLIKVSTHEAIKHPKKIIKYFIED